MSTGERALLMWTILSLAAAVTSAGAARAQNELRHGPEFGPFVVVSVENRDLVPPRGLHAHGDMTPSERYAIGLGDAPAVRHLGLGLSALPMDGAGRWTIGLMGNPAANGNSGTDYFSRFAYPFVSYTSNDSWTAMMTTQSVCGVGSNHSMPINFLVLRPLPTGLSGSSGGRSGASFGGGVCYWSDSSDAGTNGVALRVGVTIPFAAAMKR